MSGLLVILAWFVTISLIIWLIDIINELNAVKTGDLVRVVDFADSNHKLRDIYGRTYTVETLQRSRAPGMEGLVHCTLLDNLGSAYTIRRAKLKKVK
jgi:hypothetical protein